MAQPARQPVRIGRYQVVSRLGSGGMGTVYLAQDPLIGRRVAIKVLSFEDESLRERFMREAHAAGRLSHPNIVTVFDVGEHEGQPFIAMEYVPGRTLSDLARDRSLTLSQRLRLVEGVASGLEHAHRAGIVHRDVKPANVVVTEDGTPKILDFGVARLASAAVNRTQAGVVIGTPSYMSPEQISGHVVDARADVFAVGVLLYELLSGRRPFESDSVVTSIQKTLNEVPPPPSSIAPGIPAELDAIVEKAMAKSPAVRYQSMANLGAAVASARGRLEAGQWPGSDGRLPQEVSATLLAPPSTGTFTVQLQTRAGQAALDRPRDEDGQEPLQEPADSTVVFGPRKEASGETEARLVVQLSPDPRLDQASFALGSRLFEIGRDTQADLRSADMSWSKRHARIERTPGGFVIHDLGSRNGTFVNGRKVSRAEPLFFGATIRIGQTVFVFAASHDLMLPDLTGCEVGGRYVLEMLIRESPRAAVYAARMKLLPKRVAIKLMAPRLLQYPGYRERFRREAEIASALAHPHIRPIDDYGEASLVAGGSEIRTEFVCFPLAAGGSLADRLDRQEPFDTSDALRWLGQLGAALGYAHAQQVLHGDLKPSVVLFDECVPANAYLSDFTIGSRASSDLPFVIGSPAYMAPELWDGETPTPATDQFSLAVLAYYMLTGVRPFEGQDNPIVRGRNFARGPMPAHEEAAQRDRRLRPAVSGVLARALQATPGARFASIAEFVRVLTDAATLDVDMTKGPSVFLSYQRGPSAGWATYIADRLRDKHGIDVFLDVERVDAATRFPDRVARAIRGCGVFVCLLGPTTLESSWVREEIRLACKAERPMIPLFLEGFVPSPRPADDAVQALMLYDGIRLLDQQNLFVKHAVDDLAARVRQTIGGSDR